MFWNAWVNPATVIGGLATGFGAAFALGALLAAYFQIRANAKSQREAVALQAHRDYLRLCFDNPEFSSTHAFRVRFGDAPFRGSDGSYRSMEGERYQWFLSILLNTCEQVLLHLEKSEDWRETMRRQLTYHAHALEECWPRWKAMYGEELDILVQQAINSPPDPKSA
jgi:hypothetical protein